MLTPHTSNYSSPTSDAFLTVRHSSRELLRPPEILYTAEINIDRWLSRASCLREGSAVWGELDLGSMLILTRYTCLGRSGGDTAGSSALAASRAPVRKHCGNSLTSGIAQWATDKMLELWNIYTRVSPGMSSDVYRRRAASSRESFSTQDVVLKGHGRQRRSRTDSAGMQNHIDRLHKSTYRFHNKVGIQALRAKGQAFKQDYKWWEWRGR